MLIEHLKGRNFDPLLYSNPVLDLADNVLTVYMYTVTGICKGYQQYRPEANKLAKNNPREGRYFTWVSDGYFASWGTESLWYRDDVLVVVEGIFDACRLHNLGIPAIASFGSYSQQLKNWLVCTGRNVYTMNDAHGTNRILNCYPNLDIPSGRADVGECTETEIVKIMLDFGL